MRHATLILGAAILLALIANSRAASAQPVGHNGSIMELAVDQRTGAFTIVYAQPKTSLFGDRCHSRCAAD